MKLNSILSSQQNYKNKEIMKNFIHIKIHFHNFFMEGVDLFYISYFETNNKTKLVEKKIHSYP